MFFRYVGNWNNASGHATPCRRTPTRADESDGLCCRVRATATFYYLLAAPARNPLPSGSLGWAEGGAKRRARSSDGRVLKLLSSCVFWLGGSVLVRMSRSGWLKNWAFGRHDRFLGATAGEGCAMVRRRGRGYCPGRLSLRFAFYRLDCDRRRS